MGMKWRGGGFVPRSGRASGGPPVTLVLSPPARLGPSGYDDSRQTIRRFDQTRRDCKEIERKRRMARLTKLGAVMVLLLAGWAAAYFYGAPWLDSLIFSLVVTTCFGGLGVALWRRSR